MSAAPSSYPLRDGPTGLAHAHGKIRNPFRHPTMRQQFDAIIGAYDKRHKDVVHVDREGRYRRHLGNAWANNFWRGFDGVAAGRWDPASRQTPAYACWRAGEALRAALPELPASWTDEPPAPTSDSPEAAPPAPGP